MNTYFNELLLLLMRYAQDGDRELLLRDLEGIDREKRDHEAYIQCRWIDPEDREILTRLADR